MGELFARCWSRTSVNSRAGSHMRESNTADQLVAGDLVGTWRLRSWESREEDGSMLRPFGEEPVGYVVYTADGRMITTISKTGRAAIGGDVLGGPAEARAAAFASFISYSGTFRVEGNDVIHSVEISLFPDWVGGEQRRHVQLSEDRNRLTLSTDPMPSAGRVSRHHLSWDRIEA